MLRYIFRRLLYGVFVLIGVITVVFVLFNILPGDPARMMLGQRADIATIEAINKDLGRDKSTLVQFANYLNDLSIVSVHDITDESSYWYADKEKYGEFVSIISFSRYSVLLKAPYLRRSYQSQRKVVDILKEAFPVTALLAGTAILFALLIGVVLGVFSAIWKDGWFDRIVMLLSVVGMSLPSFFAAIIIAWFFAFVLADFTGLNMFGSLYAIDDFGDGEYLELKNLILPAFTLGIRPLAIVSGLTRSSLLEVLQQDYIRTAKAKGLGYYKMITAHALKNALNPVVTAVSGWFASLMAGAVFVEYIFDWKGVGVVIVNSLEKYDFPVIMGVVLFVSVVLVVINIFVDILYGFLDPRIRYL